LLSRVNFLLIHFLWPGSGYLGWQWMVTEILLLPGIVMGVMVPGIMESMGKDIIPMGMLNKIPDFFINNFKIL
jgi:hypothetical protein